jgi:hypothetical protein
VCARGVREKVIDLINLWRKLEGAKGRCPTLSMKDHYSDIEILVLELVVYSRTL